LTALTDESTNSMNVLNFLREGPAALTGLLAMAGWLLLGTGCQTTSPTGDKVLAYETVEGRTLSEIRLATLEVFQKNGFAVKSAFGRDLIFEQKASTMSSLAFGAWMDPNVWLRVKIRIEEVGSGVDAIECNVYRVQNRGDNILEEEDRAYEKKKKPFQKLLTQIKEKLNAPPPAGGTKPAPPATGAGQK
jgi:hypothetical protein